MDRDAQRLEYNQLRAKKAELKGELANVKRALRTHPFARQLKIESCLESLLDLYSDHHEEEFGSLLVALTVKALESHKENYSDFRPGFARTLTFHLENKWKLKVSVEVRDGHDDVDLKVDIQPADAYHCISWPDDHKLLEASCEPDKLASYKRLFDLLFEPLDGRLAWFDMYQWAE